MRSRGDTLAAHWAALEKHFQHHAKLVARFRETGRETLVAGICVEPGYPELGSGIMLRQRWQGSSLIVECMKVRQCSPETQCQRIGGPLSTLCTGSGGNQWHREPLPPTPKERSQRAPGNSPAT